MPSISTKSIGMGLVQLLFKIWIQWSKWPPFQNLEISIWGLRHKPSGEIMPLCEIDMIVASWMASISAIIESSPLLKVLHAYTSSSKDGNRTLPLLTWPNAPLPIGAYGRNSIALAMRVQRRFCRGDMAWVCCAIDGWAGSCVAYTNCMAAAGAFSFPFISW